ncbi:histidine kinase [Actinoplanes oblitus]|uniref:Oxygen sensor histidine kinase NreB n=1 Tax=Actinoplanes oblitus TaxID=3040509 RepID=A0ABY8WFL9_9ACTN|nr:ATP-binding protein [Actinoplanes oblitus]WIM94530.1 histidine kinase [Actinoplanes oblitus]
MAVHHDEEQTSKPEVSAGQRQEIYEAIVRELKAADSALLLTWERSEQLRRQVDAVLDDVDSLIRGGVPVPEPQLSAEIGQTRSSDGTHPLDSWFAADVLFSCALRVLTRDCDDRRQVVGIALHLNRSLMNRMGHAATAYVDALLQRNLRAQREERKRVAREMHDRAAHSVGVALQSLELHELYSTSGQPGRAGNQLATARQSLHEAIATIRAIATEVRDALGGRGLGEALTAYVERFAGPHIRTGVTITGDPGRLDPTVAEELYLILREAVYNTFLHADAAQLDVRIRVDEDTVVAEVTDDGAGFSPRHASGIGFASMRERLSALGGRLELVSRPGRGASVRAIVPLGSRP